MMQTLSSFATNQYLQQHHQYQNGQQAFDFSPAATAVGNGQLYNSAGSGAVDAHSSPGGVSLDESSALIGGTGTGSGSTPPLVQSAFTVAAAAAFADYGNSVGSIDSTTSTSAGSSSAASNAVNSPYSYSTYAAAAAYPYMAAAAYPNWSLNFPSTGLPFNVGQHPSSHPFAHTVSTLGAANSGLIDPTRCADLAASNSTLAMSSTAYLQANAANQQAYQLQSLPRVTDDLPCPSARSSSPCNAVDGTERDIRSNNKSRPRKRGASSAGDGAAGKDGVDRVFVWDLDETLIVLHSLMTGHYAQRFSKNSTATTHLGTQFEDIIFWLAETHLFFNDLIDYDQVHVDDASSDDNGQDLQAYNFAADGFVTASPNPSMCLGPGTRGSVDWMRKLAYRYRRIKDVYNQYHKNVGALFDDQHRREQWMALRQDAEMITDNWVTLASKCLNVISQRSGSINVLVSTTQLVPTLTKLLVFGLSPHFNIENVYSSTKVGKLNCFERIVNKYGHKATYVVVGHGPEDYEAARSLNLPYWRVLQHSDLKAMHSLLDYGYL